MKNTTKLLTTAAITLAISSVTFAQKQAEAEPAPAFSANVTIANDYVWRGKTQTDDEKTIQGGFDYDFANGFALGVWASNVTVGSEFDYYGSYSGESDAGIGYEFGYISYNYSADKAVSNEVNFDEAYFGVSYAGFGLTHYKGNGKRAFKVGDYTEASYEYSAGEIVDISATIGSYGEAEKGDNSDYKVYGIGLSKSINEIDYSLSFTRVKESDKNSVNEKNTVFSISKTF
ncbi:MAG: hypothetical protein FXV79_04915 [Candidatus Thioglobus sp.]|nr:MAG: hypothetical protein FXV80_05770 [Candidatus Thioglobus sp.]KAA0448393.1 MAG: hypothetical protein FXV79_04915 [Candidatus Thioglobus sp.]